MNKIDQKLHMNIHRELSNVHPDRIFSPVVMKVNV